MIKAVLHRLFYTAAQVRSNTNGFSKFDVSQNATNKLRPRYPNNLNVYIMYNKLLSYGRDHSKLDTFSTNVQRYLQNHAQN